MVLLCTIRLVVGFSIFSTMLANGYHIAVIMGTISFLVPRVNILCDNLHGSVFVLYFKATSICLGAINICLTPVIAGLFMPFLEVLIPEEPGIFLSS